ncbi:unnamed protein product, partial [Ectocarpus sp. 12 AP-2014]
SALLRHELAYILGEVDDHLYVYNRRKPIHTSTVGCCTPGIGMLQLYSIGCCTSAPKGCAAALVTCESPWSSPLACVSSCTEYTVVSKQNIRMHAVRYTSTNPHGQAKCR